ncbi:MAG: rhombosortase [Puniceicoccaceae bacterium]|nr:MAG: rhombosortase [Puniceicoccaceae bacterium]
MRAPWFSFGLAAAVGGLAVLPWTVREALLWKREAILAGEWWRLWTGHWVHFSGEHLGLNLLLGVLAAGWLERRRPGWLLAAILLLAPLLALGLLVSAPGMAAYGGLSGLNCALLALAAFASRGSGAADRWAGRAAGMGLLLVLGWETAGGGGVAGLGAIGVVSEASAHRIGAGLGASLALTARWVGAARATVCLSCPGRPVNRPR